MRTTPAATLYAERQREADDEYKYRDAKFQRSAENVRVVAAAKGDSRYKAQHMALTRIRASRGDGHDEYSRCTISESERHVLLENKALAALHGRDGVSGMICCSSPPLTVHRRPGRKALRHSMGAQLATMGEIGAGTTVSQHYGRDGPQAPVGCAFNESCTERAEIGYDAGEYADELANVYHRVASDANAKSHLQPSFKGDVVDSNKISVRAVATLGAGLARTGIAVGTVGDKRDKYQNIIKLRQALAALLEERASRGVANFSFADADIASEHHSKIGSLEKAELSDVRAAHIRHFRSLGRHLTSLPSLSTVRQHFDEIPNGHTVRVSGSVDRNPSSAQDLNAQLLATASVLKLSEPTLLLLPSDEKQLKTARVVHRRTLAALGRGSHQEHGRTTKAVPRAPSPPCDPCPWWSAVLPEDLGGLPRDIRTVQANRGAVPWPFADWEHRCMGAGATEEVATILALASSSKGDGKGVVGVVGQDTLASFDEHEASLWWYGWGRRGTIRN